VVLAQEPRILNISIPEKVLAGVPIFDLKVPPKAIMVRRIDTETIRYRYLAPDKN
jgi:hypothetical protein